MYKRQAEIGGERLAGRNHAENSWALCGGQQNDRPALAAGHEAVSYTHLLGVTKSAISHQLKALRLANLVKFRKEAQIVYYSLADDHVICTNSKP